MERRSKSRKDQRRESEEMYEEKVARNHVNPKEALAEQQKEKKRDDTALAPHASPNGQLLESEARILMNRKGKGNRGTAA
eukprot:5627173-Amphidinium_carterae.1